MTATNTKIRRTTVQFTKQNQQRKRNTTKNNVFKRFYFLEQTGEIGIPISIVPAVSGVTRLRPSVVLIPLTYLSMFNRDAFEQTLGTILNSLFLLKLNNLELNRGLLV